MSSTEQLLRRNKATRAVAAAAALIFPLTANALGLGELQVTSALGEPFSAFVKLVSYDPKTSAAHCFRALQIPSEDDIAYLRDVRVEVARQGNGQAVLLLRSPQRVNDPISRVMVQISCGTELRRSYYVMTSPREYDMEPQARLTEPAPDPATAERPVEKPSEGSPAKKEETGGKETPAAGPTGTPPSTAQTEKPKPRATPPSGITTGAQKPAPRKTANAPSRANAQPGANDRLRISPSIPVTASPTPPPVQRDTSSRAKAVTLAATAQDLAALRQEIERRDAQQRQEQQAYMNLEIQMVSLRRQIEELKAAISHKEATDARLAAELADARRKSAAPLSAMLESPAELTLLILGCLGIAGLSALFSFQLLRRQHRRDANNHEWAKISK